MQSDNLYLTHNVFILLVGMFVSAPALDAAEQPPVYASNDGVKTISWQPDYETFNQLLILNTNGSVQASYPVISGQGWVVSGLSDGRYTLQLTKQNQERVIGTLEVEHYSLKSAVTLFGMGALMFAYLLYTLFTPRSTLPKHD
ncbi:hypothetical protein OPS25_07875 [Alteromonas ponticola]|uniref:Two component regulator three Y domain-containing protein n=1 Tax=Alteromonas aquimaris TaxID=2998417 RepID=A0ABT3P6Q6_9ALTE|nr:hypothetical protein [Alteromonas aquimaris]MCW8108409.1 hypothetical protein [Alteromonas aquimaris]